MTTHRRTAPVDDATSRGVATSGSEGEQETRMFKRLQAQRLIALFFAGALLFNFPLLALWDRDVLILGVPLFPAALFLLWTLLILLLAAIVETAGEEP
jgi:hypothetical protein